MTRALGREDIRSLLADLAAELNRRGVTADVFLVGGAAIAVAYDVRRATRDLDGLCPNGRPTRGGRRGSQDPRSAAGLAQRCGEGFLPGPDPGARPFFAAPGLQVDVASPEYLLAMKLFSARVEADGDDIRFLYRLLGFTSVDQGLDLVQAAYSNRPIHPKVHYVLAEIVESLSG